MTPRKRPTLAQQQDRWRRYSGKCAACRKQLAEPYLLGPEIRWRPIKGGQKFHWHHWMNIESGGGNETGQFGPLCDKPCHLIESRRETRLRAKTKRLQGITGKSKRDRSLKRKKAYHARVLKVIEKELEKVE